MTLQQLVYAMTIADAGSFSKAAELLYVAQPSLTKSIRELEKELGIVIFNRGSRGVTLTNDGTEFAMYARQVIAQYNGLCEKYGRYGKVKRKFGVSTQHYSFAVKSFVEMVKQLGTDEYEFALRETKTLEVIEDVASGKSEIGILFLSDFNRKAMEKLFATHELAFTELIRCEPFVYLWKGHPLAGRESIAFEDLADYPCLAFEQGPEGSFYLAEEILSTKDYPRMIRANDRATMLNLMVGLGGYTLCSGIICEELNGSDFAAIPFESDEDDAGRMEIGYITRKNTVPSRMAELYIFELQKYLHQC
ncbi:MAG: LysR family transcriptional regulator [Clostridia bacterium]|nr:LysR family transcriptional regulator [Clostridia bacterium]